MFNIEKYLQRFSKNLSLIGEDKEKIIEVINKYTKINIKTSDVEIKDYKIKINTSTVGKNQIFLFKNKIIDEINSTLNVKVVDIN